MRPRVSVIMGTYNCRGTIEAALDSLVAQTFEEWELIVCDDASTDGTYEYLTSAITSHNITAILLRNATNRGLHYSLNRCLAEADGDYIARMDGDDLCEPHRLELQVKFLDEHPELHVVGTGMRRFDESGRKDALSLDPAPSARSLRRGVPFAHATIMMRKSAYSALGGYKVAARTRRCEDYEMWFRFYELGFQGANIAEPLYLVREDESAVRRRTFQSRIELLVVTYEGYNRLGFPAPWYGYPLILALKGLVPPRAALLYRRLQARKRRP